MANSYLCAAEIIYAAGSPVVNKITKSIHGVGSKSCEFCDIYDWIWQFKIRIHDKLHLMLPNHIDVNRSPAYQKDGGSRLTSFCKLKDHENMTFKDWFKDKDEELILTGCTVICKNCIVNIYEIIPELAYKYAYKYFLLTEYILELSPDNDFINYMVKNICYMIIQMLKSPSIKAQSEV